MGHIQKHRKSNFISPVICCITFSFVAPRVNKDYLPEYPSQFHILQYNTNQLELTLASSIITKKGKRVSEWYHLISLLSELGKATIL